MDKIEYESLEDSIEFKNYLNSRDILFDDICSLISANIRSFRDYIEGYGYSHISYKQTENIMKEQNEKLIKRKISNLPTRKDALAILIQTMGR